VEIFREQQAGTSLSRHIEHQGIPIGQLMGEALTPEPLSALWPGLTTTESTAGSASPTGSKVVDLTTLFAVAGCVLLHHPAGLLKVLVPERLGALDGDSSVQRGNSSSTG
jgi:hypothetical protein